ncbi:MAG TPA: helix-turn-helix transcriptional regulator [Ktedonobacteraceae bacterium]|nr:helix-turn-helix transcriptional regulator [Ktedonobacteraceae bacterium]
MASESEQPQMGKLVGMRIREARKARNLTQSKLAGDDFSVSYISAIERGQIHPSLRALEIFAQRLGLSSKDLLLASSTGGIELLESGGTNDNQELDWHLLMAHVLLLQGAVTQAIQVLEQQSVKAASSWRKIRVLYLLALAHERINRWQESDYFLSEAARLAKDAPAPLALRLLDLQGIVQTHIHTHSQGMALHQQCRELLETIQPADAFLKVEVYGQLGYHLLQLNRIEEAREMFVTALQQTEAMTPAELAAMYYELAGQEDALERIQATLAAYKSLLVSSQLSRQARFSELHHMLGRSMQHGDREQARMHLVSVLGELPSNPFVQASAHVHLAAWDLDGQEVSGPGGLNGAKSHAREALTLLQATGDSIIAADACFVLARIEYAQRHYKAGDLQFETGLAILERLNALEDLAERYAEFAGALELKNELHRAVHYWKKAYETRLRMKS